MKLILVLGFLGSGIWFSVHRSDPQMSVAQQQNQRAVEDLFHEQQDHSDLAGMVRDSDFVVVSRGIPTQWLMPSVGVDIQIKVLEVLKGPPVSETLGVHVGYGEYKCLLEDRPSLLFIKKKYVWSGKAGKQGTQLLREGPILMAWKWIQGIGEGDTTSYALVKDLCQKEIIKTKEMALDPKRMVIKKSPTPRTVEFQGSVSKGQNYEHQATDLVKFNLSFYGQGWEWWVTVYTKEGGEGYAVGSRNYKSPSANEKNTSIQGWHFRNQENTGPRKMERGLNLFERDFDFRPKIEIPWNFGPKGPSKSFQEESKALTSFHVKGLIKIQDLVLSPPLKGQKADIERMSFLVRLTIEGSQ